MKADEIDTLVNALKPSPLDYAAWAGSLLRAAEGLGDKPAGQVRLYERAYEYGLKKAKGYPTAIKAAEAGLRAQPHKTLAWQQRLLEALRLDWKAADRGRKKQAGEAYVDQMIATVDELRSEDNAAEALKVCAAASRMARTYAPDRRVEITLRLKGIREDVDLQEQVERCKRLLKVRPTDVTLRERLIRMYVADLDEPAEAQKLLTADVSEQLRTCVRLAAKRVDAVPKEVCMELGDWYRSLAARATWTGRGRALTRAKAYYRRCVKLEPDAVKGAIPRTKLAKVQKELGEAGYGRENMDLVLAVTTLPGEKRLGPHGQPNVQCIKRGELNVAVRLWGKGDVFCVHPLSREAHAVIDFSRITRVNKGVLAVHFHSHPVGNCVGCILVGDGKPKEFPIAGNKWLTFRVPFDDETVRVEVRADDWWHDYSWVTYQVCVSTERRRGK